MVKEKALKASVEAQQLVKKASEAKNKALHAAGSPEAEELKEEARNSAEKAEEALKVAHQLREEAKLTEPENKKSKNNSLEDGAHTGGRGRGGARGQRARGGRGGRARSGGRGRRAGRGGRGGHRGGRGSGGHLSDGVVVNVSKYYY